MTTVQRAQGAALARAALAGNPSDGYGGAVLAVALPIWAARAEAVPAGELGIEPANELVGATVRRFARDLDPGAAVSFVRWSTSIPQRVGLGSSSALVIAVVCALAELHRVQLEADALAEFALAVETEEMGIVAGLQDRVAQAYEGLTFMEFGGGGSYERLDPAVLPPLVIAWRKEAAADSGDVHGSLRARHDGGEPEVHEAMESLASAAREARHGLVAGDLELFRVSVDRTFDLRRELLPLDRRCVDMVELARSCDASANYTGSGGAIVAVCRDAAHAGAVADALGRVGCGVAQYP